MTSTERVSISKRRSRTNGDRSARCSGGTDWQMGPKPVPPQAPRRRSGSQRRVLKAAGRETATGTQVGTVDPSCSLRDGTPLRGAALAGGPQPPPGARSPRLSAVDACVGRGSKVGSSDSKDLTSCCGCVAMCRSSTTRSSRHSTSGTRVASPIDPIVGTTLLGHRFGGRRVRGRRDRRRLGPAIDSPGRKVGRQASRPISTRSSHRCHVTDHMFPRSCATPERNAIPTTSSRGLQPRRPVNAGAQREAPKGASRFGQL
jgi:hypothetical protein